jgi:hypothetical protein
VLLINTHHCFFMGEPRNKTPTEVLAVSFDHRISQKIQATQNLELEFWVRCSITAQCNCTPQKRCIQQPYTCPPHTLSSSGEVTSSLACQQLIVKPLHRVAGRAAAPPFNLLLNGQMNLWDDSIKLLMYLPVDVRDARPCCLAASDHTVYA